MSAILRSHIRLAWLSQRRCISTSKISRTDIVQNLYLNELRSYKAPPPAKDAHVGVVKDFSSPAKPSPPPAPTDLASELAAYDAVEPQLGSTTPAKTTSEIADDAGAGAKEYLAFLEKDLPKPEHHH